MQKKYWNNMAQYRYSIFYLEGHLGRYAKMNRRINILLAVASSGAVATWAVWNTYPIVWAIIIAASQVGTIINSFLPYTKRIGEISELRIKLLTICNDIEYNWFNVCGGKLSEVEINHLLKNYKDKWDEVDGRYLILDSLPENAKIATSSELKCDSYLKAQFPEE